jgi:hypothetical protein
MLCDVEAVAYASAKRSSRVGITNNRPPATGKESQLYYRICDGSYPLNFLGTLLTVLCIQILRFRSKDGTVRVEVDPNDDVGVIAVRVELANLSSLTCSLASSGRMQIYERLLSVRILRLQLTNDISYRP